MKNNSDAIASWKLWHRKLVEVLNLNIVECDVTLQEIKKWRDAVVEHHAQRSDDRCFLDDDKLYEAFGLPPVDRRVGDKEAMLKNCARFIEKRCEPGGWPTYAELEAEIQRLKDLTKPVHCYHSYTDLSCVSCCMRYTAKMLGGVSQ